MPPTRQKPIPKPSPARRTAPPEVVDPAWLLKALAVCVVAALLCGYATLCLLFYQGEWQLVLHPSHTVDRTPAAAGLVYTDVHFDSVETGQPRLTAWWIPAAAQSGFQPHSFGYTILYLHDGSGSLATTVPMLARLHAAGLGVFAIDYRGFGASDTSAHPSQQRMAQDTAAAFVYLTQTRHIAADTIIPYGTGLGASLAASLARTHPELPAVILDNPDPDPASAAVAAHPSRLVPVRLLFGNRFDVATPIAALATPKLLIAGGPSLSGSTPDPRLQTLFAHAASPSITVTFPSGRDSDRDYQTALSRFLDQLAPNPVFNRPHQPL